MDIQALKRIVEGALLAAGDPLSLNQLNSLFPPDEQPGHGALREALAALDAELEYRAVELTEVGSGYRLQIRADLVPAISQLWTEKPPRYSRALLETLAIIAYRQPITRSDIEQIRGVSISSNILRTLQERDWIQVVGHRDVPGRPELLGTTRAFLDYFNLKSLDQLPTLAEIKDIDNLEPELDFEHGGAGSATAEENPTDEQQADAGSSEDEISPDEEVDDKEINSEQAGDEEVDEPEVRDREAEGEEDPGTRKTGEADAQEPEPARSRED